MPEDRRGGIRRVDDIRELLRFCHKFGQTVPTKVAARLAELGIPDAEQRPIPELLAALDQVEQPLLDSLPADRRRRPRRWINPEVIEDPEDLG